MSSPSETPDPASPDARVAVPLKVEDWLTVVVMAALALITFANVLVRYFTNASLAFTEEYSVALMVIMTLVGSAAAFGADRHIRMTFFTEKLGRPAARRIEQVVLAASFAVFAAIAYLGVLYVWDEYRFEVLSPGLGVPQWQYTVWMPLLAALICLRILGRMVRVLRSG